MPYSKQERARLAEARKKKENQPKQIICPVCRTNTVFLHPRQIPRPCMPCFHHLAHDTCVFVARCHWCNRLARRDFVTALATRYPYCGTCRSLFGDGLGGPDSPDTAAWEGWPWHGQREAVQPLIEALAASPYGFVCQYPSRLFPDRTGWKALMHVRDPDPFAPTETLEIFSVEEDHFLLWPMALAWINEQG